MHPLLKVIEPPRARPVTKLLAVVALGVAALPAIDIRLGASAPVASPPPTEAFAPAPEAVPPPGPLPTIEPARPRVMPSGAPACGNVTRRAPPECGS